MVNKQKLNRNKRKSLIEICLLVIKSNKENIIIIIARKQSDAIKRGNNFVSWVELIGNLTVKNWINNSLTIIEIPLTGK